MTVSTLAMDSIGPTEARQPVVSNPQIAMAAVIVAELMLFAGLIGAYLVFRLREPVWPPPGLPKLPLGLTTLNTIGLVASAFVMGRSTRAMRAGLLDDAARAARITALLGVTFVGLQGAEWARLVHHGMTLGSSVHGGTFYVLIGCHAVHVLCGVLLLLAVTFALRHGYVDSERPAALQVGATYWYFVTALWLVLFPLVYVY